MCDAATTCLSILSTESEEASAGAIECEMCVTRRSGAEEAERSERLGWQPGSHSGIGPTTSGARTDPQVDVRKLASNDSVVKKVFNNQGSSWGF